MATVKPCTALTRKTVLGTSIDYKTGGTCKTNTSRNLFYCNSPETLENKCPQLADDGRYFLKDTAKGVGRIYTWHENKTGKTIISDILAYNPGNKAVTITITNRGLTNAATNSDVTAWKNFFAGSSALSYTLNPGAYLSLAALKQTVATNRCFGVIANFSIEDSSGTEASLVLCDYAYANAANQSKATALADEPKTDSKRRRGIGNGVYTYMYATLELTATTKEYVGYKYGVENNSELTLTSGFGAQDLRNVVGESKQTSGLLLADFGLQLDMQLTVKNSTGSDGDFRIALGSNGGVFYPIINKGGVSYANTSGTAAREFTDVMEINGLKNGESVNVNFFTVVPAGSNSPVMVCAHKIK